MQEYIRPQIPEEQLVKELNKMLKENGFTRDGRSKRWTKKLETGFALLLIVESSRWEKGDYDVRVGVAIIGVYRWDWSLYGNFDHLLPVVYSAEQVYGDAVKFFNEWTDIRAVRERVQAIKEWRDRNPAEYLRTLPRGTKKEEPPYRIPLQEPWVYDYVLSPKYLEDRKQFLK